jgi:alpha-mannosidase
VLTLHVVAHTHWDREWYHPAERFRQRLVALIDELIEDPPRDGESFLLDGQTIVLDDYLAVRPERAEALYQLLRDGRLEAGPWFVLADELIPSGEALVRNLLAGRRTLRRIGVPAPPVLYCPDSFGHPAALPSLAAGFGLPLIILWRGYGGRRWPSGDVVRWIAPGGDAALIYHLPHDGYEFGSHLSTDVDAASARWKRIRDELAPRSTTGIELLPNGADHHARQLGQREAVAALAAAASPDVVRPSSLRAFSESIVSAANDVELPVVRGELRDSYGYTWTLQGTFGTRAHEKRMNARAERLLLREAEPWAALASRVGQSRRPLVDAAWRTLLEAHPHDTLCGTSIDEVAEAMELRIRSAANQARGIRDDALAQLIGHDPVAARQAVSDWTSAFLVRNPAARPRGGLAILDLEVFAMDVPVGPGSGTGPEGALSFDMQLSAPSHGQLLSYEHTHALVESPRHYPDNDLVVVASVAVWSATVPAYGVASLTAGTDVPPPVRATERSMENGHCRVIVDDDARVVFDDLATGRRLASLIEVIDEADAGDEYTPAPRPSLYVVEPTVIESRHRGPLIADLSIDFRIRHAERSPVHRDLANRLASREARTDEGRFTDITVRLTLEAGAPWLRVDVEGENRLENHRVRLRLRTDVVGDVWADAAFGAVLRAAIVLPPEDAAMEIPPKTAPLHRYVSRFDEHRGCTVFSDGLAEYESADDGSIYVSLVRAVGDLSVRDLPERPGNAGWPRPTPGAQCIRGFAASLAVMLHGARTAETIDAIERAADDILLPLRASTLRSALRVPDPVAGIELHGAGLAFSTIKESEDGQWLVLRCVNLIDAPVAGSWRLPFDVLEAQRARLDETGTDALTSIDRVVSFEAAPREIVTVLVR